MRRGQHTLSPDSKEDQHTYLLRCIVYGCWRLTYAHGTDRQMEMATGAAEPRGPGGQLTPTFSSTRSTCGV